MGEHAVVYGKPALLATINRRLTVTIEDQKLNRGKGSIVVHSSESDEYVCHAITTAATLLDIAPIPPMVITITSDILPGHHLGSSAATAVGVVGAFSFFAKKIWNPTRINNIAYEVEKKIHGNPSGGDNTAVTVGGFIWFRKELEFLKSIWQIPMSMSPEISNNFYLIDTGRPEESTGEMVAMVRTAYDAHTKKLTEAFHDNETQTKRIASGIKENNAQDIRDGIKKGERTLETMGVVSEYGKRIIRTVERFGGAAKILGGGGKKNAVGYVLAYHENKNELTKAANTYGLHIEPIELGAPGILLEKKQ